MSEFREVEVANVVIYRCPMGDKYINIKDLGDGSIVSVAMADVIPFVKAIFSVATGREFVEPETRWGKPDTCGADDE